MIGGAEKNQLETTRPHTVMIITLGPVQEFIAQARKTRDLWFGSHLLSEISKEAARHLLVNHQANLIFPHIVQDLAPEKLKSLKVANKVVAIVETDSPREVALDVQRAVVRRWHQYADLAKERLLMLGCINESIWDRQVSDLVEFYAVWASIESFGSYAAAREQAENLMAARKTLRDFRPNKKAKLYGDKKSSLDPGRESVLLQEKQALYKRFGVKKGETLDAISMVKRMSRYTTNDPLDFISVCDIAFRQYQHRLSGLSDTPFNRHVRDYYEELKRVFPEISSKRTGEYESPYEYDSRFFYAGRIEEGIAELAQGRRTEREQEQLVRQMSAMLEQLYQKTGVQPTPYFALLVADGDRMGECLKMMDSPEEHRQFSKHLSRFAEKVEEIVQGSPEVPLNRREGQLVYSGGDDVMAFVPVYRCLEVSERIRQAFAETMEDAVSGNGPKPTISIGIAIVHMMEPLGESLRRARQAEMAAKGLRDALAIHFQKRSGSEELKVVLPFRLEPVQAIRQLMEMYAAGEYSTSFAYSLRQLHADYDRRKSQWDLSQEEMGELLHMEVQRLIKKKMQRKAIGQNQADHAPDLSRLSAFFDELKHWKPSNAETVLERLHRIAEQFVLAATLGKAGGSNEQTHSVHPAS
jgi:CRISPR-associated protein Cas10/Cmr2, subtype III-B